ncbi:MAG: PIG-L family deacetylase [Nanoarchaeota archaeon]
MNKKKVLVIVAHPDDETIWMGGTILSNLKKWDLTILSLCRRNDSDRAPRFSKACKNFYHSKSMMSDLEDVQLNDIPLNDVIGCITKTLSEKKFDFIFTHGNNGEYGHKRHKDVHKAVNKMIEQKLLSCKKIFFFSYFKKDKLCYPNPESNKFINLGTRVFMKKKFIITKIYGFNKGGFEEQCCRNAEAFNFREFK